MSNSNGNIAVARFLKGEGCPVGYTNLKDVPEVQAALNAIANSVAQMTVYLMVNGEDGDTRITNGLSRLVDIDPNDYQTKLDFYVTIVKKMLIDGNAIVLPKYRNVTGRDGQKTVVISQLIPKPFAKIEGSESRWDYRIDVDGKKYKPSEVLHFKYRIDGDYPYKGTGIKIPLREIADNLRQARTTEKELLANPQPNLIMYVARTAKELTDKDARSQIASSYTTSASISEPWLVPIDMIEKTQEIKNLTLTDLAIKDTYSLNKRAVASIFGIPAFMLGEGAYSKDEMNNFITRVVLPIANALCQELTKKLLISPDLYFTPSLRRLYQYSLSEQVAYAVNLKNAGIINGNEARDMFNLSPVDGLNEYTQLENFIPVNDAGNQEKLQSRN